MQWQEVRELFPNQFVLLSILKYHEKEGKKIITEVAPVRVIPDQDANREFFNVEPQQLVYHTSNEECVIHLRNDIIDSLKIEQIEVDVGMLPKSHKGLLGLDILKSNGFVVDLGKMELRLPDPVQD